MKLLLFLLLTAGNNLLDLDRSVVTQQTDTLNYDCIALDQTRLNDILLTIADLEYADNLRLCYTILDFAMQAELMPVFSLRSFRFIFLSIRSVHSFL